MNTSRKQDGSTAVSGAVLYFLFLFLPLYAATSQTFDRTWNISASPVKTNLTKVVMNRNGEGYAVGKYLLRKTQKQWMMASDVPWSYEVNTVQKAGEKILYASTLEPTNESILFRFNGVTWNRLSHPLANFITSVSFTARGTGWLGGWGEMAYFNGREWKMYPPIPNVSSVLGAVGTAFDDVQIYTSGHGVYRFSGTEWKRILPPDSLHAFMTYGEQSALVINGMTVLELKDGRWQQHSSNPSLRSIISLFRESNGTIWGVGANGTVVRYDGSGWTKIVVPTTEQLNDIAVEGTIGTIVGNNGMILQLGTVSPSPSGNLTAGFRIERIFYSGKGLDGEYGAAIEDVTGDQKKDLYTVNLYNENLLFINRYGSGTMFRDETALRGAAGGAADTTVTTIRDIDQGIGIADLDNDGDRELLICSLVGHNSFLLNKGEGYFHDVSENIGRGTFPAARSNSVSFADVDNDGDLDMFVANEASTNRIYQNNGNGYFTDVTETSGLTTERGGVCSTFGDIDQDGKTDLVVTFWTERCRLYKNISNEPEGIRFIDITERSGIGGKAYERSNGAAFGDIDNDGDLDLFIAKRRAPSRLYRNDGDGQFTDVSASSIGTDTLISYGIVFADMDHDGWLDAYLTNVGTNRFYRNNRNGMFTDRTFEFGLQHTGYNTGVATGDVDNDGDIDLYTSTYINGESALFLNNINDPNYIKVNVEGTRSNRDAVGAVVRLYRSGEARIRSALLQHREVTSGSGYASHSAQEVHFGAEHGRRYDVVVTFPASGIIRTVSNVPGGSVLTVREEEGVLRDATLAGRFILREVNDPSIQFEGVKLFVMLIFSAVSIFLGKQRSGWNPAMNAAVHIPVLIFFVMMTVAYHYEESLLAVLLPLISSLTMIAVVHLYYEQVILKRSAIKEKENTRRQIARDLHDDIASTLSSATIYLNVLQRSFKRRTAQQNELLLKVNEAITSASEGMTDIVWAIAPKHDTFGDLIARIRIMIGESASAHSIRTEFRIAEIDEQLNISEIVRRNIYLIFKEAMNNVCKHASARNIIFSVHRHPKAVVFILLDDGIGIPDDLQRSKNEEERLLHGNGLGNMRNRAQEIGARFELGPGSDGGTKLTITIEMMHLHH